MRIGGPIGGVFRNNLREERMRAGFRTQVMFARATDIEPSWYVRIENGRTLATPDELDRIVRVLGGIPLTSLYDAPYLRAIGAARAARTRR